MSLFQSLEFVHSVKDSLEVKVLRGSSSLNTFAVECAQGFEVLKEKEEDFISFSVGEITLEFFGLDVPDRVGVSKKVGGDLIEYLELDENGKIWI